MTTITIKINESDFVHQTDDSIIDLMHWITGHFLHGYEMQYTSGGDIFFSGTPTTDVDTNGCLDNSIFEIKNNELQLIGTVE